MLNSLLVALNDCVWAFDADTQKYLFISPSIQAVTEYLPQDFQENISLWDEITDPHDKASIAGNQKSGNSEWTEHSYRIATKSGKIKWVQHKRQQIIDGQTGHHVLLNVISDISDQKQEAHAQEEILWTKNNLEALINNTEDLTWSIDREGKYVYMNSAYRKRILDTIGAPPQEGDNAYLHSGPTDEINSEWRSYYQRAFDGERYVIRHESSNPKTKEPEHFEVSFNPIYKGTKDKIVGVGCFARNITERLKTEEALIDQNERLKNIASLSSHELRRPVASMIGLLNILDRENFSNPENKQIMDHLHTVTQEIDEVIRVIVNKTFIDSRFNL